MKFPRPTVDYRKFRLRKLGTPEFSHLKWLLFWPIFGLLFFFVERVYPARHYYPMHCALDDYIPFEEIFLLPYLFWFVYLVWMHLYTLFYDVPSFRPFMKFITLTYGLTILIYLIFPTCQNLRPEAFVRDNVLTRFVAAYYAFDTNTNVCPSIHVLGAVAVHAAAWHCQRFRSIGWRIGLTVCTVSICLSTVFLKQHSILDVLAALPLCVLAWRLCYPKRSVS